MCYNVRMNASMKSRIYIIIGEKIKKYRGEKSQGQLAKTVKISRASIANIEKGRQHVTIATLWTIAAALKIDPHLLLPTEEEAKPVYDDIYLKQLNLSEEKQKWVKEVIKSGENN